MREIVHVLCTVCDPAGWAQYSRNAVGGGQGAGVRHMQGHMRNAAATQPRVHSWVGVVDMASHGCKEMTAVDAVDVMWVTPTAGSAATIQSGKAGFRWVVAASRTQEVGVGWAAQSKSRPAMSRQNRLPAKGVLEVALELWVGVFVVDRSGARRDMACLGC